VVGGLSVPSVRILCLNTGSSSLKFALYELGEREVTLATGAVDRIGDPGARLSVRKGAGAEVEHSVDVPDGRAAIDAALAALDGYELPSPEAVGHRVVHGGPLHRAPERVDARLLAALKALVPFAPLHLPTEIEAIEAVARRFPDLPQVVCFDTAFHRDMPEIAQHLPLPRALWDAGIRRYGFHGLSYEYVVHELGAAGRGRIVIAHLGNGASMAAVRDGRAVETTMGLTPAGGLMMGTRPGDLDPGVLLHLLASGRYGVGELTTLIEGQSGLLGVSGLSADVRTLLAARERNSDAALAIAMFCHRARREIGALAAVLGGIDTLVFTGGIGEHSAVIRREICSGLEHLGVALDPQANEAGAAIVSPPGTSCVVRVVETNEDLMVARHTRDVLQRRAATEDRRQQCKSA
jgi:acetate kinase